MQIFNRRSKAAIIGICLLSLLTWLGIQIYNVFEKMEGSLNNGPFFTYGITAQDSNLIAKNYLGKLKVDRIVRSKGREPISFIYFDKKYHLIIYRIFLFKD